jgi:NADPH:quinone reductase-like Zn-dependent oxidoreductase
MYTMKAAIYEKYGSPQVLKIQEIKKPAPEPGEIMVKVYKTTVSFGDVLVRKNIPLRDFNMPFFSGLLPS